MNSRSSDLQQRAEARIGRVLRDKWRLERLLGLGGMAAVYLATHRNGKRVAIKILHPEAALVPDIKARFQREGYLANKVNHPGAVSILDDDTEDDGTVFLVMELLTGETLEARCMRDGTLPWELVLLLAYKVLDVLCAAHEKDIVHRDLKPANIFLDAAGAVKILDFGIARLNSLSSIGGATLRDSALGTPGFMPPEQARGHWDRVDARSDIWAIGANMFSIISGRHVHEATTVNEQLLAAMTLPAPALSEVSTQVPAEVCKIVDRALSFEKDDRFSSAYVMQQEVRALYEALTERSIDQPLPIPIFPRSAPTVPSVPSMMATLNEASTSRSLRRYASTRPLWRKARYSLLAVGLAGVAATVGLAAKERAREAAAPAPAALPPPVQNDAFDTPSVRPTQPTANVAPSPSASAESAPEALKSAQARAPRASARKDSPKVTAKSARPESAGADAKPAPPPAASTQPVSDDDDFFDRRK